MLHHPKISGMLELSTRYTWTDAEESLKICTDAGIYRLTQMEELTFTATPSSLLGIPLDKVLPRHKKVEYLCSRNNFTPVLANNQVVSQGFFHEIEAFVRAVEEQRSDLPAALASVRETYVLLEEIRKQVG